MKTKIQVKNTICLQPNSASSNQKMAAPGALNDLLAAFTLATRSSATLAHKEPAGELHPSWAKIRFLMAITLSPQKNANAKTRAQ